MEMTVLAFVLGLMLLAVPATILYIYKVKLERQMLMSVARMLYVMLLTGLFLYFAFTCDSAWLNLLFFVLMVVLAAAASTRKLVNLPFRRHFVPVLAGMAAAALIVGGWLLLVAAAANDWQVNVVEARWLLPVTGVLVGSLIGLNSRALAAYHKGFEHHSALYYYLLGNGATRREAVAYLMRQALQQAALPVMGQMAVMMVGQAPMVVWAMLMSGVGVWTAVAWQVLLLVAVLAASMLSVTVALVVVQVQEEKMKNR